MIARTSAMAFGRGRIYTVRMQVRAILFLALFCWSVNGVNAPASLVLHLHVCTHSAAADPSSFAPSCSCTTLSICQ